MRVLFSLLAAITLGLTGCGGGVEPDTPASLTAEQEQEILQQVESAAQSESGQVP